MINTGMMSSNTDMWATPQKFFDELNNEFHFTLDPCAIPENAKCAKFYTPEENGLLQDWDGEIVFCNPPYGRAIGAWVEKCHNASGNIRVALLPARTDTKWFHDYIYGDAEIRFIKGRLKFGDAKNSAPFPSMVVIWREYAQSSKATDCKWDRVEYVDKGKWLFKSQCGESRTATIWEIREEGICPKCRKEIITGELINEGGIE